MKLLPNLSEEQEADFFTKLVHPKPFLALLSMLGMVDIYRAATCGGPLRMKKEERLPEEQVIYHSSNLLVT